MRGCAVRPQPGRRGGDAGDRCGSMASIWNYRQHRAQRCGAGCCRLRSSTTRALRSLQTPDEPFTLEIVTYINPEANTALQGIYRSRGIYCTQCEAQGFRRITYFLDRPDVLVRLHGAPRGRREGGVRCCSPTATRSSAARSTGGKRHYAVWKDPHPKPCYLFALVGGDLSLDRIDLHAPCRAARSISRIYVEHGKEERAHWAMDSLKRSMAWDEQRFGREYDLDVFNIVAVSDFNMGAMENKGLNIFNDRLDPGLARDRDGRQLRGDRERRRARVLPQLDRQPHHLPRLVPALPEGRPDGLSRPGVLRRRALAHRAAHRGCAPAEGPAVSRGCGPAGASGAARELHRDQQLLHADGLREGRRARAHDRRRCSGRDGFRTGMDLYFERHDGDAATDRGFRHAASRTPAGSDLSHFTLWYAQAGTPELVCELNYDAATQDCRADRRADPQRRHRDSPSKKPLHIPLRLGLLGANGHDLPLELDDGAAPSRRRCRASPSAAQTLPLRRRARAAGALAAARLLRPRQPDDRSVRRRSRVPDDARQRSVQSLAGGQPVRDAHDPCRPGRAGGNGSGCSRPTPRRSTAALCDPALDDAYKAELLKLPTQSDIAREKRTNVDHAAIDQAPTALCACRSPANSESLLTRRLRETSSERGPFTPDASERRTACAAQCRPHAVDEPCRRGRPRPPRNTLTSRPPT